MKKLTALAYCCLASIFAVLIFSSCKKQDMATTASQPLMNVLSTSPSEDDLSSRYDINIIATLNTSIDTSRFSISFTIIQNDAAVAGDIIIAKDKIRFVPEVELLPLTSYSAVLSINEKINPSLPVLLYKWAFTTKVPDAFQMTQRSTSVTDFNRDGSRSMQIGNYLYSFGGWIPEESFNDVYRSKGDLKTWEKLPNAPWHGRHVYGIAKLADSTYVIGGDNLQNEFDVWRTVDGENWKLLANDILNNRIYYGCASHNGYIYIIGGSGYNDVWRSGNGTHWELVNASLSFLKGECFAGSLASFNGKLWIVCGGTNGYGQGTIRNEVWSSTDGVKWQKEKNFAGSKRYYTDICVWDNKLWVVGGYNFEEGNIKSIWYMKPDGSWKEFDTPIDYIGRHATGVAVYNNQLAITCGNYNNDCWVIEKLQ